MHKALIVTAGAALLLAEGIASAACPPPEVDILSPANLSTGRPTNTSIFLGGPSVETVQTAKLSTSGGSPIMGVIGGVPGLLVFIPGQQLSPDTAYHVDAVDFSNAVVASADFMTGTTPDTTAPTAPGNPVAVVSSNYDFGNSNSTCPTTGGWPVTVTWTPATDDNPIIYALQAAVGNVALEVSYSATNATLATFEAPGSTHIDLLLRAYDGSLNENQSSVVGLDTAVAPPPPPTPTPSPTATPGNGAKDKGCGCDLDGSAAPALFGSMLLAAAALCARLMMRRRATR